MADGKSININFPFQDSDKGYLLELNTDDSKAIKADLMHLILTRKGERLYLPDFGTDLLKYIFEPNDNKTQSEMKQEMNETIKKYLPKLQINELKITQSETNEYVVQVRIDYTVTEDVFEAQDFIIINI